MPFVKNDPAINRNGRPRKEGNEAVTKPTNRQLREKEFLMILRKIKPLVADSINTAAKIMRNEEASHQNQLKAAVILLENYKDMIGDLYDKGYDEEGAEELQQDNAPVFSLKVVNNE